MTDAVDTAAVLDHVLDALAQSARVIQHLHAHHLHVVIHVFASLARSS
jgi:hypothetical protein